MNVSEILTKKGIRPSLQRMAVLEYLINNPIHPSVDQIYKALQHKIPTFSKTTVYNTLRLLEGKGLVIPVQSEPDQTHWDANLNFHAHFICNKCYQISDIFDFQENILKENIPKSLEEMGHYLERIEISYKGVCEKCYKKEKP